MATFEEEQQLLKLQQRAEVLATQGNLEAKALPEGDEKTQQAYAIVFEQLQAAR